MDSSAFELLILPACYRILLGLLGGLVVGRLIRWLGFLMARLGSNSRALPPMARFRLSAPESGTDGRFGA